MTSLPQLFPSPKPRPLLFSRKFPCLLSASGWALWESQEPGWTRAVFPAGGNALCALHPPGDVWQRTFLPKGTASYVRGYLAPPEREGFPLSEMDHLTPSCFISNTFSFHGFPFYLVTMPRVFAWSHLSLKMATKEISTARFFSSNMPSAREQIQPKNPPQTLIMF